MTLCLSFPGVAGNFPMLAGCANELLKMVPPDTKLVYAGISSGSVIASMLAVGLNPEKMVEKFEHFITFFTHWYHHPITYWFTHTRRLYRDFLEPDSYLKVSGRLFIGYSVLTPLGLKPRVVSEFTSNDDLIDAIFASCHIMPYKFFPLGMYRGEIACDGAFTRGNVRPPNIHTLAITTAMVHSNVFWSDWVPDISLEKTRRLYSVGQAFIRLHESHFQQQLKGGERLYLKLPKFFNPFRWMKRLIYFLVLVWMWRRPLFQKILSLVQDRYTRLQVRSLTQ
jgi:hypothetical protein